MKSRKFFWSIILSSFMLILTIIQYNHDKNRVLHEYNKFTLMLSQSMRINESTKAKQYYLLSHKQNMTAAKKFARSNMFHYSNLFKKGVDHEITVEASKKTFNTTLDAWVGVDFTRRFNIYEIGKQMDPASGMDAPNLLISIENYPSLYGDSYYKDEYQNQSDYLNKSGDILQQYIDDEAYNDDGSDTESERESNINSDVSDEKNSTSTSSYSDTKKSKNMEKIDNNFRSVLSTISNKFSDEEAVPYHAGSQSIPKMPSEYKKIPKIFTVTFSPIQSSVGNQQKKPTYTVKLSLNKKDNVFVITNFKDLPNYLLELGK